MRNKLDQFRVDADKLLVTADTMSHSGLFDDDNGEPIVGINVESWERYKAILRCFVAAKDAGNWNVLDIRYDRSPNLAENFAAITVKMRGACGFTPTAKVALAMAAAVADDVSTTISGNITWFNFVVSNLWEEWRGNDDED